MMFTGFPPRTSCVNLSVQEEGIKVQWRPLDVGTPASVRGEEGGGGGHRVNDIKPCVHFILSPCSLAVTLAWGVGGGGGL